MWIALPGTTAEAALELLDSLLYGHHQIDHALGVALDCLTHLLTPHGRLWPGEPDTPQIEEQEFPRLSAGSAPAA